MSEAGAASTGIPPVSEVVFDVQFLPVPGLTTAHFGLLWSRVRSRFHLVEDQPPLEPDLERLPGRVPSVRLALEVSHLPPMRRLWLLTRDRTELLQLQQDRFIRTWRRLDEAQPYPRYLNLKTAYRQEWNVFISFLQEEGLPAPQFTQCDLTYVNRFPAGIGWDHLGQAHRLLRVWNWPEHLGPMEPLESVRTTLTFLLQGRDQRPVGRLYVHLLPGRDSGRDYYHLQLSARGRPESEGIDGAFDFFELGHTAILRAFRALCQPDLLSYWKLDLAGEEAR